MPEVSGPVTPASSVPIAETASLPIHGKHAIRSSAPTMKDIADIVDVSIKSVSRVLNNEPGVSPATSARILAVAEELGFRRNDLARSLRSPKTGNTIGVVAQHTAARFFIGLIRGMEQVATEHGALMLTAAIPDPERELSKLVALSSRRMDALVIAPRTSDQSSLRAEQAMGVPLVFVDQPPIGIVADTIVVDNHGGAQRATAHLLGYGHRRIGVVGSAKELYTMKERLRGYSDALKAADIPFPDLVRLDCLISADAQTAANDLLASAEPPTAIFAMSNVCTLGVARALHLAGRQHEIALVGFDDIETADLFDPPLTVVAQDVEEMGREAARLCFSRLAGDTSPPVSMELPTVLIPRGSGELLPRVTS